jgi:hypothetical protein
VSSVIPDDELEGSAAGAGLVGAASRLESAAGLKLCLTQLREEAMSHGFMHTALHLRIAMMELDDMLVVAQSKANKR